MRDAYASVSFGYDSWRGSSPESREHEASLVHHGRDPVWNIGTTRRAVRPMSVRVINVSKIVISDRT